VTLWPKRSWTKGWRELAILFGLLWMFCGVFAFCIRDMPGSEFEPPWVGDVFGWGCLLAGLLFFVLPAVRGILHDRRVRGSPKREKDRLLTGQPWDQKRAHDRLSHIFSAYGRSTIQFETYPFYLGEDLVVHFEPPPQLVDYEQLVCTLRCLTNYQEQLVGTDHVGRPRGSITLARPLWSRKRKIARPDEGRQVDLRFKLPDDQPETAMARKPPIYWELEIRAETSGIDYWAIFTVPVYRKRKRTTRKDR